MKKLLTSSCVTLLFLSLCCSIFFTGSLPASARSIQDAPDASVASPYCRVYLHYVAQRLNVSEDTLLRDKLAAKGDVLDQLVREGKLTQAQANRYKAQTATVMLTNPCY